MTTTTPRISTFLPPLYAQRLARAAAARDDREIDAITDEIAKQRPDLVRPRAADGWFKSQNGGPWGES